MRTRRRYVSPNTTKWSTHSRRIVPISRYAKPFCHGEPAENWLIANAHGAQAAGDNSTVNEQTPATSIMANAAPRTRLL